MSPRDLLGLKRSGCRPRTLDLGAASAVMAAAARTARTYAKLLLLSRLVSISDDRLGLKPRATLCYGAAWGHHLSRLVHLADDLRERRGMASRRAYHWSAWVDALLDSHLD